MTQPVVTANETPCCEGRHRGTPCGADREVDPEMIREIVEKRRQTRGALIAILEAVQDEYGYLPELALRLVSEGIGRPLVEVYGVATFYRSFSLKPRGRHIVCACLGTACHVRGAPVVVAELERRLGIKAGETSPLREFTLETANCLGACALGPIVVVDGQYSANASASKVKDMLERIQVGESVVSEPVTAESVG